MNAEELRKSSCVTPACCRCSRPRSAGAGLKGCPVDANGFCPVDKFNAVMNNAAVKRPPAAAGENA